MFVYSGMWIGRLLALMVEYKLSNFSGGKHFVKHYNDADVQALNIILGERWRAKEIHLLVDKMLIKLW